MSHVVVAVMQPYFFPYAGYFRLLAAAETFVVFDDVQFPRRGRVHRCELPPNGEERRWLTLPIGHHPRDVTIRDLRFAENARETFDRRLARLTWLERARGPLAPNLRAFLHGTLATPNAFASASVRFVSDALGLEARIVASSEIAIPQVETSTQRILAIVRAVGGDTYLNAPGGRALYDPAEFAEHGVRLRFLEPYRGRFPYMLPALAHEDAERLREDVLQGLDVRDA